MFTCFHSAVSCQLDTLKRPAVSRFMMMIHTAWYDYDQNWYAQHTPKTDLWLSLFDCVGWWNWVVWLCKLRDPSKTVCSFNQFYCYINAIERSWPCQFEFKWRADEIILCDIAHLRPRILMRLHYNGITFFLIKMGKVTRAFIFGCVALGCRHICGTQTQTRLLMYTHMHKFFTE